MRETCGFGHKFLLIFETQIFETQTFEMKVFEVKISEMKIFEVKTFEMKIFHTFDAVIALQAFTKCFRK